MGSMDVVPFLGKHFYLYFPIVIILVCVINLLNLTTRVLKLLRIKRFQFDENFNDSAIDEGAQILHDGTLSFFLFSFFLSLSHSPSF